MNVLVTGSDGFIGRHLMDRLLREGFNAFGVDKRANIFGDRSCYTCDINDSPKLSGLIEEISPEVVFHLAAQTSVIDSIKNPLNDVHENVVGSLNLFELLKRHQTCKKLIFTSTGGAMYAFQNTTPVHENARPSPSSPYGCSKLAVEKYLKTYRRSFDATILRLGNVYGPGQDPYGEAGVVAKFLLAKQQQTPLTIYGDGQQTRDFVYVDDVIDAFMLAMKRKGPSTLHIASGRATAINEIAHFIAPNPNIRYEDPRHGECKHSCLDISNANMVLKWSPKIPLVEGLAKTSEFFATQSA